VQCRSDDGACRQSPASTHPAIFVKDVKAAKARLDDAGILVSDAGVYAMAGMHQIYVLDPTASMVEVNQFV
jgi:hypothetical protein